MTKLRSRWWAAAGLMFVVPAAFADGILLPVTVAAPWLALTLIPGIFIEGAALAGFVRGVHWRRALWVSFVMNIVSTLAGGVFLFYSFVPLPPSWATIIGLVVLTFLFSVVVERAVAKRMLAGYPVSRITRAVIVGNVLSYALISILYVLPPGRGAQACEAVRHIGPLLNPVFSCANRTGGLDACSAGANGIPTLPAAESLPYVQSLTLEHGVLTATLTVTDRSGHPLVYRGTVTPSGPNGWQRDESGTAVAACRNRMAYRFGFWLPR